MYGALAFKILVDISSYPCEVFAFKSLITSSISPVVVCYNLIFVNGRVYASCRYVIGLMESDTSFPLFIMFSSIILSTMDRKCLLKFFAIVD
jgi:hypothetical protein